MKNRIVHPLYTLNIVIQSFFDFATPILIGAAIAYVLNTRCSVGAFVYAIFVPLGAIVGGYTMIRSMLAAFSALERLEAQNRAKETENQADPSAKKDKL